MNEAVGKIRTAGIGIRLEKNAFFRFGKRKSTICKGVHKADFFITRVGGYIVLLATIIMNVYYACSYSVVSQFMSPILTEYPEISRTQFSLVFSILFRTAEQS